MKSKAHYVRGGGLREIAPEIPSNFKRFQRLKLDRDGPRESTWPAGLGEKIARSITVSPCFENSTQ
jgi:hypothetical protein